MQESAGRADEAVGGMPLQTRIALILTIILAIAIFLVLLFPAVFGTRALSVAYIGGTVFVVVGVLMALWGLAILTKVVFRLPVPGGLPDDADGRSTPPTLQRPGVGSVEVEVQVIEGEMEVRRTAERAAGLMWLGLGGGTVFFGAVAVFLGLLLQWQLP